MTAVVFVRHGEAHNPRQVIYSRLPRIRLAEQGHEHIKRTAHYLASLPVVAIYTSPLLRARQSAAAIAAYHPGVPVRRCVWLTEVATAWRGEPLQLYDRVEDFTLYSPKGEEVGESIEDVFRRMDRALRMVLRRHPSQTTVCVSHGDPIKILQAGYSGRELTLEVTRLPDPPEASLVAFHFWHPDALPIIAQVDPRGPEEGMQLVADS